LNLGYAHFKTYWPAPRYLKYEWIYTDNQSGVRKFDIHFYNIIKT